MFQIIKRDDKNEPIRTRKMVIWVGLREAHNLVIDSEENGGCALARDNEGRVIISCTALRRYWHILIVKMTKRFQGMCMCHLCGVPEAMQLSFNNNRTRRIKRLEFEVALMDNGVERERTKQLVERYKSDIMGDRQLRVGRVYEAASEITCPRIEVND